MAKLIIDAANVPSQVTEVTVGNANNFSTGGSNKQSKLKHVLKTLRVGDKKQQLYIRSGVMQKKFGVWVRENAVLPVERCDDEVLYSAIKHFEAKTEQALSTPDTKELVRPLYSPDKETAWIKLALDFEAFNWQGKKIPAPFQFGTGSYQLILRATNIYCGEHGTKDYKYSVLFKICQIRYQEEKLESMFDCDTMPIDECMDNDGATETEIKTCNRLPMKHTIPNDDDDANATNKPSKSKKKKTKTSVIVDNFDFRTGPNSTIVGTN